ncbi:sensor histidine kinase [Cryptosporangium minutisporangium]|uniref:histidine kinase n=1 Tax=Cryptosporangium minutisporangium TaxID=113569 RepID=A0ABP6TBR0_9ACTN
MPRFLDAAVALVMLGVIAVELTARVEPGAASTDPLAYLLAAAFTVPYALHRRAPTVVLAVTAVGLLAYSARQYAGYPGYAMFVLVFAYALHVERPRAWLTYVVGLVVLSAALAVQPETVVNGSTWFTTVLVVTVAWLGGEYVRARRARWAALEDRARRLEAEREERARQAVTEERMRIARELHDVVAHSMSVVAVQAGVAHHVIERRPDLARQALGAIEATSRSALVEMRRLLGVLRQPNEPGAALAPSPGLGELDGLVAQYAGLAVTIQVSGDVGAIPPGVDLSAYRIVQESLTNVLKHGGPSATLRVTAAPDHVRIEVTDPGPVAGTPQVPGTGHGLIGMRERVAVFGGSLDAGPCPDGGFRVSAVLPFGRVST